MDNQEKIKQITGRFSKSRGEVTSPLLAISEEGGAIAITAQAGDVYELCDYLKKTLKYDYLQFLTCVDKTDKLEMVYYLYSYEHKGTAILKTNVDRLGGKIKSVSSIWKTADWHEREAYDLFGVVFEGHPELKHILLDEDFVGHPLLKDYVGKNVIKLPKT